MLRGLTHITAACALFVAGLPASCLAFDYLQPLPDTPLIPADNPLTAEKIALGKVLYFDNRLLGNASNLSCNSCHNLAEGGDDNQAKSKGQNGEYTTRSSPGLWNIGLQTVLYWDGRSTQLELQTLDHLRDPKISRWLNLGEMITAINRLPEYQKGFAAAFPEQAISAENLARAIASFERSLLSADSLFDQYLRGDETALSVQAKRGLTAFNENGCLACHFGVNFAGPAPGPAMGMGDGFYELFPNNLGTHYEYQYHLARDKGRYAFTGNPDEQYMWRVPPLRNIALTAPYFHNGSVKTLEEAIRVMGKTQVDKTLSRQTVDDIAAFLRSLTGKTQLLP